MLEKCGLSGARVVSKQARVSDKSEVLGEWAVARWGAWGLDGGVSWQSWWVVLESDEILAVGWGGIACMWGLDWDCDGVGCGLGLCEVVAWLCGVYGSDGCGEREGLNELDEAESRRICSKILLSASSIP